MKIHLPVFLVCAVAFTTIQAQTVHSISIGFGPNIIDQPDLLKSDVLQLVPLDPESVADYSMVPWDQQQETFCFVMSIGLLPFSKEDRRGPELRLGFIHAGWNERQAILQHSIRTPYDTLVSTATGEQFLVDSVHGSTYFISTKAERIGLDASLAWSTTGRWSLYVGVGVMGGPSFNARTYVDLEHYNGVGAAEGPYAYSPQGGVRKSSYETFKGGNGWWTAAYFPFGIDFTLSRKHPFWKQMHLSYELRPQLLIQGSPELDNTVGTGLLANFGIRLTL
ncbi:MAG: hypothetical protein K8H89_07550 [Flavobacteriales bacterium]|nr:hypothetical protein [Flavobacteriales bacterium]MCB0756987.1 hypothetical protein [Flavobacteriales bacterium]